MPTLVITGNEDTAYPLELSRRMASGIPHAELVVLAACGHLSYLEQPEAFNEALLDFLLRRSNARQA